MKQSRRPAVADDEPADQTGRILPESAQDGRPQHGAVGILDVRHEDVAAPWSRPPVREGRLRRRRYDAGAVGDANRQLERRHPAGAATSACPPPSPPSSTPRC